jgi:subtilase family serine protease
MGYRKSFGLPLVIFILASFGAPVPGSAAAPNSSGSAQPSSRVAGDWRTCAVVRIGNSEPPQFLPDPAVDSARTAAPADARLERVLLLLAPSAAQQKSLDTELANQLDSTSTDYHRWMTAEAFANSYANSAADVAAVSAWLESQGLQVAPLPAGRGWIEFSGTVAALEQAFHTRIDLLGTPIGSRYVLADSISVPGAFAPLVQGLVSLDGTFATPALTQPMALAVKAPDLAAEASINHAEALTPMLAGELLHFDGLHGSGINGAGETIAIPSRSNISASDVAAFRAAFGLPPSAVKIIANGADPGLTPSQAEATLAASWAGVAAPGARIIVMPTASTKATDGLDLSLAAIVDQAAAHIVAIGDSLCENALTPAHQGFYAALYRQAAAEGISMVTASGDSGAAACHGAGSSTAVSSGYAVNALASTPWNTAVGVSAFSAFGPSPEAFAVTAWSPANTAAGTYAGGGGSSLLYPAPDWQPIPAHLPSAAGSAGVHNRLLPDLSLPTAGDSAVNPGLAFCLSGSSSSGGCELVRAGGSSASAALFAGIAALINQKNGQQGNLAPHLYELSRQEGIFSDVDHGGAWLPCVAGSSGCGSDGQIGFAAESGFDLATGLGVVNAQSLVNGWAQPAVTGTGLANVTNTTGPSQTINPSGSIVLSANVVSATGGPAPTGTVSFKDITLGQNVSTVALDIGTGESSTASVTVTGVLAQGGHQIVADYSGDTNYAAANSQPIVVEVQPSSTTTAVVPSTSTPVGGITFTVSATITSVNAGTGAVPPSGTLDFRLDGVSQGTKQVVTGTPSTASISMTAPLTAGAHQVVGFYSGDNNYYNSTSNAGTITVSKSAPTLTITPSTTTPLAGSSLQISATIAPAGTGGAAPTGTVTFTLDGASVGTSNITAGSPSTATVTITAPNVGGHTLAAAYSGDTNYTSATAAAVTITIAKVATTLALTPATTTPLGGSSLLVTASISITGTSAATPTGAVTITMDGVTQGTPTVMSGTTATLAITVPASGSHTLQASYAGDANFLSSTSPSVNITVAKTPTTTVASVATTSPSAGTPIVVTATITASTMGSTQPTGNMTFTVDGASAGVASVVAGSPSTASVTISSLAAGSHALVATYSGDTFYASSVSVAVTVAVSKSPTTTVATPATLAPTAGASLAVSATVTSSSPASAGPTGTVTYLIDGVMQGTGILTAGTTGSTASYTIPSIVAGSHVLTATYAGDTSYAASTSAAVAISSAKSATVTTVTATPPVLAPGLTETLTASIAPASVVTGAVYSISGTVSFYDNGGTLLGTTAVSSNTAMLAGVALANNVSHAVTAIYSGDTNFLTSTSAVLPLAATTLPDNVVLTSNLSTLSPGQALVLTVTVTPSATPAATAEQNATGNIIFYDGTTVLGTVALAAAPTGDSSTAMLTISTLPGGEDTVYAAYAGDLYYDAGNSNLLTLNIEDFTIVPSPSNPATNLNIVQGTSGAASFVVTGLGGFNNTIQVVCAAAPQDDMTCTASPQQLSPPGSVTFVVQTFLPGQQTTTTPLSRNVPAVWPRALGGSALALLGFFLLPIGRRARIFTDKSARRMVMLLLLLCGLGGVAIGCSNSGTAVNGTGTPLGVATLKITASANVDNTVASHSVYLTVNVTAPTPQ